jgi:hypothetical protein
MQDFPEVPWMERYRERVNADPEMELVGSWFSTSLSLTFGERRYVLRMERGRMTGINATPDLDARCSFGFRAPLEVWRKFVSPEPPTLYHDFFAMLMRVPEFVLEGDSLVAMQNARALHRLMNIMRETGAPA